MFQSWEVVKEGYLERCEENNWIKRYFSLREDGILVEYGPYDKYLSPNEYGPHLMAVTTCFGVHECEILLTEDPFPFTFILQGYLRRTPSLIEVMFHAESKAERNEWIQAIRNAPSVEDALTYELRRS